MRAPPDTIGAARRLRRSLSPPEAMLWSRLRNRTTGMPTFRRQHPMGPYVLDFYCAPARLAVEIDGRSHELKNRPQRDERRDAWLEAEGVKVLRIAASEVLASVDAAADGVMRMAAAMIEERAASPLHRASRGPPPPLREGG
jgi:very-short-patch-repair endonuclease